jgi:glycosyltransferase involved in cell wall biosynthesis
MQLECGVHGREHELELDLRGLQPSILELEAAPLSISEEQRRHGDTRALGAFIRRITVQHEQGESDLDLRAPAAAAPPIEHLSSERFRLSLHRSVVRFADAFLVHSQFMKSRIAHDRNAPTPIGVVHHGAQPRWSDEQRKLTRRRLGLDPDWCDSFLLTSFGGVQAHKRIAPLLRAFAAAHSVRADLRLALIGAHDREMIDVHALARELGVESALRLTGRVDESAAWSWIHAGDFAVQLRGPSTGGSSGGVFQSLSLGRGVIASDLDEQRELPSDAVLRVGIGAGEVEELSRLLLELAADPKRRAKLEAGARRFVTEECNWSAVAARYAEFLARFPRARASRFPLWRQPRRG